VNAGGSLVEIHRLGFPMQDTLDFIYHCGADILFETIPVNYETGQPAVEFIRSALESGMHVATANKGPVVHAYHDLTRLAAEMGVKFYFESAVMDGAPVFGLFRETLPAANVHAFRGVLNSTTNLILSRMEQGESFDQAVKYAQSIGIAETDPSGDVDGWDAAIKVCALATVLMGVETEPRDVDREGIRGITSEDIELAKAEGKRWKLVCEAHWDGGQLHLSVSPQMVGIDSPLYGVDGTTSILQIESDVLGKLSLIEEDPGPHTTAYGLLADFLNAVR
jgi:homoserine dehydrogenase